MRVLSLTRISWLLLSALLLGVLWSCAPGGGGSSSSIQEELTQKLSFDLASDYSSSEVSTIVGSGEQWVKDNVTNLQNPEEVLPAYLAGSMVGVGQITPPLDDNKTLEAIKIIVSSIVGSIDSFEAQFASNRSSRISQDVFDAILANLVTVAIQALDKTGLDKESFEYGLGEVVADISGYMTGLLKKQVVFFTGTKKEENYQALLKVTVKFPNI